MIRERYTTVSQHLDGRAGRVFAASEAKTAGCDGIAAISRTTGMAASTIGRGLKELAAGEVFDLGRVHRPGGGGKKRVTQDAPLLADLLSLVNRMPTVIQCRRCAGPALLHFLCSAGDVACAATGRHQKG